MRRCPYGMCRREVTDEFPSIFIRRKTMTPETRSADGRGGSGARRVAAHPCTHSRSRHGLRSPRFVAPVSLLVLLLAGGVDRASAHQSPPGCQDNALSLVLSLIPPQ